MFNLYTSLLGLTAALNAGLFVFVYLGDRRNPINQSFALFALSLSAWSLIHLGFRTVGSDALAGELLKLSYVSALLIGASFYYFSVVCPEGKRPGSAHSVALLLVTVVFGLVLLAPGFLTGSVVHRAYGRSVVLNVLDFLAFAAVFLGLFLGGQVRVWLKWRRAAGIVRSQLLAVGTSVTLIGLIGILFDLVLPSPFLENFRYVWAGPVLTSLFAIVITYAIFRFRLFNLRAALTELLVFAWWLFILLRALAAVSVTDAAADLGLLAVSLPIGALLLRSMRLDQRVRETLAEANARLTEADQLKSELLALATHQLRQPVTIVQGYASMLRDGLYGRLPKAAQEPVERVLHSATQMATEITDYLSVAKIDQGQLKYTFIVTDIGKMLGELAHDFQPEATKKRLRLIFASDARARYKAAVDPSKIQQVLSNLIENAIRYTERGSISLHIGQGRSPEWIRITIRDTGIGIDP